MESLKLLTDAVLRTLVGYLEFCIDLLALNGLADYARTDRVSATLLSYFIVGTTVGYFLTKGKALPGLSRIEVGPEKRDTLDGVIFGIIIVMVFVSAAFSHIVLVVVNGIWNIPIGPAPSTLNAWLASSAITIPFAVLSRRLRSMSLACDDSSVGSPLLVLALTFGIAIFVYSGLVLARIHGVDPMVGLAPGFLSIAIAVVWDVTTWIYRSVRRSQQRKKFAESYR